MKNLKNKLSNKFELFYQKIKDYLLPINHLYLLQVDEYQVLRYLKSSMRHLFPIKIQKVKKLVWTNKAKWLFNASIIWLVITAAIISHVFAISFLVSLLVFIIVYFFFPEPWLVMAVFSIFPLERFNRIRVIYMSRKKLEQRKKQGLKVVGITGSYGKTTTKFFIHSILQNKLPTYATPKSYNTLFGIAQAKFKHQVVTSVLDYLPKETKVFIVEMGAYVKGDIDELCRAFPPDIAVLTGIAEVHLERFKTIENIIATKTELLDALPKNGVALVNLDNKFTPDIAEKYKDRVKVITYGTKADADVFISVKNLNINGAKCSVRLNIINQEGKNIQEKFDFVTNVNNPGMITNLGPAIALGFYFNMSVDEIKQALANINMPESRMQVITSPSGITIINNGYNSNPISFANSIKTLSMWTDSYKVFVTPGIYELGPKTYEIHKDLGKKFKNSNIDEIILLGPITDAIKGLKQGLKEINFPETKIKHVKEITKVIPDLVKSGKIPATVLFENDVPDQYS